MDPWPRIVVHADMDAFYAAVEQLDDPNLRGKPVLVGPKSARGVVLTASYEARPYGVGSAMPVGAALRRCPHAIIVGPRFDRYQEISSQVMDTLADFSPRVEALSMDEAFVEMTGAGGLFGSPREMGRKIKQAVREATPGRCWLRPRACSTSSTTRDRSAWLAWQLSTSPSARATDNSICSKTTRGENWRRRSTT